MWRGKEDYIKYKKFKRNPKHIWDKFVNKIVYQDKYEKAEGEA